MTIERPDASQPTRMFYDVNYAPPGATNVLDHGWAVVDSTGRQIGKVDEVYDNYFSIAEGYIIHDIVYAPFNAIDHVDVDDQHVYLAVSQAEMEDRHWQWAPEDVGHGSADAHSGSATRTTHEGGIVRPTVSGPATRRPPVNEPAGVGTRPDEVVVTDVTRVTETEEVVEGEPRRTDRSGRRGIAEP